MIFEVKKWKDKEVKMTVEWVDNNGKYISLTLCNQIKIKLSNIPVEKIPKPEAASYIIWA